MQNQIDQAVKNKYIKPTLTRKTKYKTPQNNQKFQTQHFHAKPSNQSFRVYHFQKILATIRITVHFRLCSLQKILHTLLRRFGA